MNIKRGVLAGLILFSSYAGYSYGVVPAGTIIGNAATATYYDENNNQYTTTSNIVQTVVQAVCGVDVLPDDTVNKEAIPGQIVYIPFQVKNTGNAEFTYSLSTENGTYTKKIYLDKNQNGIIDPGEQEITSLNLGMEEIASVIVAVNVPADASEGSVENFSFKAMNNATCVDSSDAKITTINDAVFLINKEVDKSTALPEDTLTYTINFKNVGTKDAYSKDFKVDHNNDGSIDTSESTLEGILIKDEIPSGTSYVPNSATGTPTDNPGGYVVYSDDGINWYRDEENVPGGVKYIGFFMPDSNPEDDTYQPVLSPDQQGSLTFKVKVDKPFREEDRSVDNIAVILFKNSASTDKVITSNETHTKVPESSLADISLGSLSPEEDSGNNWQDDTTVENIPAGTWVEFRHSAENRSSVDDIINLQIDDTNTSLPDGTIIEFWNADMSAKLLDTDGDGNVDLGSVPPSGTKQFVLRIFIPASTPEKPVDGNIDYYVTVIGKSHNNPSETDRSRDNIDGVIGSAVDIGKWNTVGDDTNNPSDNDTDGTNDSDDILASDNGQQLKVIIGDTERCAVTVKNIVNPGETAVFPVEILNRSGHPDVFSLNAQLSFGQSSFFIDENCDGVLDKQITETPLLAGTVLTEDASASSKIIKVYDVSSINVGDILYIGEEKKEVESVDIANKTVTLKTQLVNDHLKGTVVSESKYIVLKVNVPEDQSSGDYNIVIKAISKNSNAEDSMDAYLKVNALNSVIITPNGSDQLPPGGTTTYQHLITNKGNTDKNIKIIVPSNDKKLMYIILDENKTPQGTEYTVPDPLSPGENKTIYIKVIAPSDIQPGTVETVSVKVVDKDNDSIVYDTADDTTTVIEGFMQLLKSADKTEAKPGEVVTYTVKYKNIGDRDALNVIITDSIPNFTSYEEGTLCLDLNCDGNCDTNLTDTSGDDAGEYDAINKTVKVRVGSGATYEKGGTVKPGEEGCIIFKVKIEE